LTVIVGGSLSAVLANDVVVFAMTPVLIKGLVHRGLDPKPYLIALARAANAGSTATVIGNPQNILVGEVGRLDFWDFIIACGPPAIFGLMSVFGIVWLVWLPRCSLAPGRPTEMPSMSRPCDGPWRCNVTSSRLRAVVLAIVASLLTGCATERSDGAPCPPVVAYSPEFLVRAGDEPDVLPPGSATEQMLADYQVMRNQARACAARIR